MDVKDAGSKGGTNAMKKLTKAQRRAKGKAAIEERWRRYYEAHPEKLAARQNGKKKRKAA